MPAQGHLNQTFQADNSLAFNDYKQQPGTDPKPVKLGNFPDTQRTFEGLPHGATLTFTVCGVNDAGEGPASEGDTVVIG